MNKFFKWIGKELDLGSIKNNKKALENLIVGLYVGLILISIELLVVQQPTTIHKIYGAFWFIISFFVITFIYYRVLKTWIYNSKNSNYVIKEQSNLNEDFYLKVLRFAKSKPNGFTVNELK